MPWKKTNKTSLGVTITAKVENIRIFNKDGDYLIQIFEMSTMGEEAFMAPKAGKGLSLDQIVEKKVIDTMKICAGKKQQKWNHFLVLLAISSIVNDILDKSSVVETCKELLREPSYI